ncbi:hypothetical protein [Streptacidiphilus sp. EB129]|uniref:hypothetical protein n=1 Tax=Streptacidiphilus sp. EB129 TaxID=3156262 RepID=UPI00351662F6
MSRRAGIVVATIACGALTLGTAGTSAAVGHRPAPSSAVPTTGTRLPTPDASSAVALLSNLGVVGPVADALKAALAVPPDPTKVTGLVATAKTALNALLAVAPVPVPPVPVPAPPVPVPPAAAPHLAPKGGAVVPKGGAHVVSKVSTHVTPPVPVPTPPTPDPQALITQAVAQVTSALDAVVTAVTSLDPTKILAAVTATVQAAVNLVTSVLLGGGLPVPNLPGLPPLPVSVPPLPVPTPPLPVPVPPLHSAPGH